MDFSFTFWFDCKFKEIILIKSKFNEASFVDPEVENIISNDLEFDNNEPMRIPVTNSSLFSNEPLEGNEKNMKS